MRRKIYSLFEKQLGIVGHVGIYNCNFKAINYRS